MRIYWGRMGWAILISVALNVTINFTLGPTAALIESVPGGLLIGALSQNLWLPRKVTK